MIRNELFGLVQDGQKANRLVESILFRSLDRAFADGGMTELAGTCLTDLSNGLDQAHRQRASLLRSATYPLFCSAMQSVTRSALRPTSRAAVWERYGAA